MIHITPPLATRLGSRLRAGPGVVCYAHDGAAIADGRSPGCLSTAGRFFGLGVSIGEMGKRQVGGALRMGKMDDGCQANRDRVQAEQMRPLTLVEKKNPPVYEGPGDGTTQHCGYGINSVSYGI